MIQAFLLSIVLISVGSSLQELQTLKDAEFVAVGGTVTISCRYNGGNLGDGHYPLWTQETAGNRHRGMISYTSSRPSGVPERFSGSRSGNMMSLTITGALVEDEATYYCCVWSGNQSHSSSFRWGSETKTLLFISF
uniref:Ig-like domain-containing protein n=1 Tax=Naja naja TaxID=35670 RepID=A0A8C7DYE4_NAJNA